MKRASAVACLLLWLAGLTATVSAAPAETYRAKFGTTVHGRPNAGAAIVRSLKMDQEIEVLGPVSGSSWLVVGERGVKIGYVFAPTVEKVGLAKPTRIEELAAEQGIDIATAKRLRQALDLYKRERWEQAHAVLSPLAAQGVPEAQFRLGIMYRRGRHVPQSMGDAVAWLSRAAGSGHPEAQNDLGAIYYDRGDRRRAAELFLKAGEQEYCLAQVNLGGLLYAHPSMDQNLAYAAYWYGRASRCDDMGASLEGDRWVRKLRMLARQRRANYKNDVIAAGILLAIAVGVLGSADGDSGSGPTTPSFYDPCDDPSILPFVDRHVVQMVCGK